jgi:hypothetical protein
MDSIIGNELIVRPIICIVSGLIADEIYHYFTYYREIWKERNFYELFKGWWIERIERQEERKIKICRIEPITKELNFDLDDYSSNVLNKFTLRLEEWKKKRQ